jgi:hypothetical protein
MHHTEQRDSYVKSLQVRLETMQWIELNKRIELAKVIDTTDVDSVMEIIEAQDHALQMQKEKAENSRRKADLACPRPSFFM